MPRKTYTREFRLKVVRAVETAELRPAQACREYQIAESVLNRWRHEVQVRGEAAFSLVQTPTTQLDYETRIAELERVCGQLAIENAALKKPCSVLNPTQAHARDDVAASVSNIVRSPAVRSIRREPVVVV